MALIVLDDIGSKGIPSLIRRVTPLCRSVSTREILAILEEEFGPRARELLQYENYYSILGVAVAERIMNPGIARVLGLLARAILSRVPLVGRITGKPVVLAGTINCIMVRAPEDADEENIAVLKIIMTIQRAGPGLAFTEVYDTPFYDSIIIINRENIKMLGELVGFAVRNRLSVSISTMSTLLGSIVLESWSFIPPGAPIN